MVRRALLRAGNFVLLLLIRAGHAHNPMAICQQDAHDLALWMSTRREAAVGIIEIEAYLRRLTDGVTPMSVPHPGGTVLNKQRGRRQPGTHERRQ